MGVEVNGEIDNEPDTEHSLLVCMCEGVLGDHEREQSPGVGCSSVESEFISGELTNDSLEGISVSCPSQIIGRAALLVPMIIDLGVSCCT